MPQRITIVLNDEVVKKARILQAKMIAKSNKSVSFSYVVNMLMKKSL